MAGQGLPPARWPGFSSSDAAYLAALGSKFLPPLGSQGWQTQERGVKFSQLVQYPVGVSVGATIHVGIRHRDNLHAGGLGGLYAGGGVFEDQTFLGRGIQPAGRNQKDIGRRLPVDDGRVVSEHDAMEETEPIPMPGGLYFKGAPIRTAGNGLGKPVAMQMFGQLDGARLGFGLQQQPAKDFIPFAQVLEPG